MNRSSSALVIEVLRSEGPRAVINRMRDRWRESVRRRGLVRLDTGEHGLGLDAASPPVLNLSPIPPAPKRGGSHIQMLDRLAEERRLRTVALAYPRHGSWWLEIWAGERAGIAPLGGGVDAVDVAVRAANLVGTDTVHVENIHGLPLELLPALEARGLRSTLSIHDFVLFCRRPHLIDASTGDFCQYSRDEARCARCLGHAGHPGPQSQVEYRLRSESALQLASAVVFPSAFLKRRHRELFPKRRPDQLEMVIAPASTRFLPLSRSARVHARIAFVGGAYSHKGGALISDIMAAILKNAPSARGIVYGNGDGRLLMQLRRDPSLRVRGYYRHGHLSRILARDGISAAILPSIWPEAYALVIDECLAAGVPPIAFDLGAVGDRLRDWGAGIAVPTNTGSAGLASAALEVLGGRCPLPESVIGRLPRPIDAARSHVEMYAMLAENKP